MPSQKVAEAPHLCDNSYGREVAKQREHDLEQAVSGIMAVSNKLEQDDMEGVDEEEWREVRNEGVERTYDSHEHSPPSTVAVLARKQNAKITAYLEIY